MLIEPKYYIYYALICVTYNLLFVEARLVQNSSSTHHHRHHSRSYARHPLNNSWSDFGKWLSPPEAQHLLRAESNYLANFPGHKIDMKNRNLNKLPMGVDCCPSVMEMVEPEGGKTMDGMYVELYRDGVNRQRFYEISCRPEVENKPCRFMDKKLHNQSKCVQKFSYTYALVKDLRPGQNSGLFSSNTGPQGPSWTLDYIEVRSGCNCVVFPKQKVHKKSRLRNSRRLDEKLQT